MDMQNVSDLQIPEGAVRTIHDKNSRLLWGRLAYDTKYVGNTLQNGTPAPDAPIAIQTVTGEQTVAVTGKNLLLPYQFSGSLVANAMTFTMLSNGSILVNGTASANTWLEFCGGFKSPSSVKTSPLVDLEHGVTYSFSSTVSAGTVNGSVLVYIQKDYPNSETSVQLGRSKQITDASGLYRAWLRIGSGTIFNNAIIQTQLELGASATSYEMPQSQNYPISLGSLELCKIGNYRDYIYKSGDDWYVHKYFSKISSNGSEDWGIVNSGTPNFYYNLGGLDLGITSNSQNLISNYGVPGLISNSNTVQGIILTHLPGNDYIRVRYGSEMSVESWKTMLSNSNMYIYYRLAISNDTKITNDTLISQLNNVHQWLTRYGYNATVTGNLSIIIDKTSL